MPNLMINLLEIVASDCTTDDESKEFLQWKTEQNLIVRIKCFCLSGMHFTHSKTRSDI